MNPARHRPLCGLVLAGGKSTRMGRDKGALAAPDGRAMVRRCHDLLRAAGCGSVAISLREGQEMAGTEGLEIVRDGPGESGGPMAGIRAAMGSRPDADWLVVACDLPRLDERTLSHLVASLRADDIFLAYRSESDGLPEPLCALYTPAALAIIGGSFSPRKILSDGGCRLLDPVTPGALDNANTPADWQAATAELLEIWISTGHDFRGRHGIEPLDHGISTVQEIECVAGKGLRGDRYFDHQPDFQGQVTFLDVAVAREARERFGLPGLSNGAFRRNLVVRGAALADWAGARFRFRGIEFEGAGECKPCYWMDRAIAPGAERFLTGNFRGGLRARILSDGILRVS